VKELTAHKLQEQLVDWVEEALQASLVRDDLSRWELPAPRDVCLLRTRYAQAVWFWKQSNIARAEACWRQFEALLRTRFLKPEDRRVYGIL